MCYIGKKQKRLIATKDIHVWKVLRSDLKSQYFNNFQYKYGKTYKTRMLQTKNTSCSIGCPDKRTWKWLNHYYQLWGFKKHKDLIYISEGFHSISTKEHAKEFMGIWSDFLLKEFIIPKGAKYYKSLQGMMVSNQIKMK